MNEQTPVVQKWELVVDPDAPVYDHFSEIPSEKRMFLFNNGHVKQQLSPYLEELTHDYGALAFKVKSPHRQGFVTYVGIEPEKLAEWVERRINQGALTDILLSLALSILDLFPESSLRSKLESSAAGRVDVEAVRTLLFGLRQQVGQRVDPDSDLELAQVAIDQGKISVAQQRVHALRTSFQAMHRQFDAGMAFFHHLNDFLASPRNGERFRAHEDLLLELDNMEFMLKQVEDILTQETIYQVRIIQMQGKIDLLQADQH